MERNKNVKYVPPGLLAAFGTHRRGVIFGAISFPPEPEIGFFCKPKNFAQGKEHAVLSSTLEL